MSETRGDEDAQDRAFHKLHGTLPTFIMKNDTAAVAKNHPSKNLEAKPKQADRKVFEGNQTLFRRFGLVISRHSGVMLAVTIWCRRGLVWVA